MRLFIKALAPGELSSVAGTSPPGQPWALLTPASEPETPGNGEKHQGKRWGGQDSGSLHTQSLCTHLCSLTDARKLSLLAGKTNAPETDQ